MTHKSLVAETLILTTPTVFDLEDFVRYPEKYLVSVTKEPARAAATWKQRLKNNPYGSDGLIRLKVANEDVFSADQWDDVDGLWHELVALCTNYHKHDYASVTFPGQPIDISMKKEGGVARLVVGDKQLLINAHTFIEGILQCAEQFFLWVETYVGVNRREIITHIRNLLAELNSKG